MIVSPFVHIFDISLFAAEFEKPKIGISGKGLTKKTIDFAKIAVFVSDASRNLDMKEIFMQGIIKVEDCPNK